MGEIPVHLVGSQTTGTATIESGLIDAWDAIRALIVAAGGESQEFAGAKVEIIAPDQKTSLSYPWARFTTGSSAMEPFRAWERKYVLGLLPPRSGPIHHLRLLVQDVRPFELVSNIPAWSILDDLLTEWAQVQGGSYMGQIFVRHLLTVGIKITGTAREIWVANEKSEMQWQAVEVEYNAGELEGIVVSEEVAAEYSGIVSVAKGEKQNSTKNDKKHTRQLVTRSQGINIQNVSPDTVRGNEEEQKERRTS
ncbi:hypothetical protein DFH08DRAFT_816225 [Mycena albidolilacea]|uniref:Uncharacterized protein n=1 Tax=Mycena albidolilacea TaxID=1033008 RepID=A0AAD6ZL28_9AGAR|nr:hypothetical protein DFH08DRAFT_816225 [Mycena albidolilacea]